MYQNCITRHLAKNPPRSSPRKRVIAVLSRIGNLIFNRNVGTTCKKHFSPEAVARGHAGRNRDRGIQVKLPQSVAPTFFSRLQRPTANAASGLRRRSRGWVAKLGDRDPIQVFGLFGHSAAASRLGLLNSRFFVGAFDLGFWRAPEQVFPATQVQRCTVHKTAIVLNKLPKSVQPQMKRMLHGSWDASTKDDTEKASICLSRHLNQSTRQQRHVWQKIETFC